MYKNVVLSIGGSDSGGGAGIQADLRTFMSLKVHGCTAITCITAQNSLGVNSVDTVKEEIIINQIEAVLSDFQVTAIKTGMLVNKSIIISISEQLDRYQIPKIIDPVMVSRAGSTLIEKSAINAYKQFLFPQADLITPNIHEANLLLETEIKDKKDIEHAGINLLDLGPKAILIKGGGINKFKGKDYFINRNGESYWFNSDFIDTKDTHGSGCTLSAAICSYRGKGLNLIESINKAKLFVEESLINSYKIGNGPGPLGHHQ